MWVRRYAGLMTKDDYAKKRGEVHTKVEEEAETYEAKQVLNRLSQPSRAALIDAQTVGTITAERR